MSLWKEVANRLSYLSRRSRFDRELEDEIRFHMETRADELQRDGMPRRDAEAQARREFGPRARAGEDTRAAWQLQWLEDLLTDLRYAARTFAHNPAFTITVIACLALGIGANTAIFGVFNAAVLRPLPVRDPGTLVLLTNPSASGRSIGFTTGERSLLTYAEFEQLRDRSQTLAVMLAAEAAQPRVQLRIADGAPEDARGRLVSEGYFPALGVEPVLGRFFTPQDAQGPGSDPFVVISHDYWQRRFGANISAVGARIQLNKSIFTIIGVAPPGFRGETVGQLPDLWIPMMMELAAKPGRDWIHEDLSKSIDKVMWLHVFGRLNPGVSLSAAQAEMNVLFSRIMEAGYPRTLSAETRKDALNQQVKVREALTGVFPGRDLFSQQVQILLVVAGLVLIIACANIANLLLARAAARRKEVSVRLSLGAARHRLIRQFLTESLLLSLCGGAAGILVAVGAARLLLRVLMGDDGKLNLTLDFDWRLLAFTLGATLVTGLIFGVVPAIRTTAVDTNDGLKDADRSATHARRQVAFAKGLVVVQVALSLLLMVGAGLFVRSLWNLQAVDLGYPRESLLVVRLDAMSPGYSDQRLLTLYADLAERLRRVPGVRGATYSQNGLLSGSDSGDAIEVEGYLPPAGEEPGARFDLVARDYFTTLGIPVLKGREFDQRDAPNAPRVCIINEALAKRYFKDRNPIGKHVSDVYGDSKVSMEVVGVVRDVRSRRVNAPADPRFYVPFVQGEPNAGPSPNSYLEVRTMGDPQRLLGAVRKTIAEFDRDLPILQARSMDELVFTQNAQPRMVAQLCSAFGVAAVLLAAIGLYGVLAYGVSRRTREMGIRMALGATRSGIAGMILREAGGMVVIGSVAGAAAAVATTRLVAARLYGVNPGDPATIVSAAAALAIVALLASYLPASRAARTNPIEALRHE